jgi:acyl carrier protein
MSVFDDVKNILSSVLQLPASSAALSAESPLLGAMPEFDSMAVVSVLTALEDHYGFFIDDDEIDADVFQTLGTLVKFIEQKLNKD